MWIFQENIALFLSDTKNNISILVLILDHLKFLAWAFVYQTRCVNSDYKLHQGLLYDLILSEMWWVFGLGVKMLLGMLAFKSECWIWILAPSQVPASSFLLLRTIGGSDDGSRCWVLAAHMGDLNWALCSQHWPGLAPISSSFLGNELADKSALLSFLVK